MDSIITRIDLFRHGEVQGGNYYRGSTDDSLTAYGWQQMREAVVGHEGWHLIISSPLRRCLDFSQELAMEKQLPLIRMPDFQELHFGDWEAKTAEQIEKSQPDALRRFYANPFDYPPPNGESLSLFQQRIATAWQQVLKHHAGKSILIVTHAGVIRTLCCLLLKMPLENSFSIQIDHASFTRFSCFHNPDGDFILLNFQNRIR